jgi:hypothetical protein
MYNQNTLQAEDDSALNVPARVGISAAGRANDFQRRIGPDGEEQDIVGPDGHTEQLPPYSQYPDGHTKPAPLAVAATVLGAPPSSPVGPGPISPVVENPPRTPGLESGTRGGASDTLGSSVSEQKSWKEKTFTEKRRTRICCGFPLWMLLTVLAAVLLCGAIIGGVVGGLMATANKRYTIMTLQSIIPC